MATKIPKKLQTILDTQHLAETIDDDLLASIASKVVAGFESDDGTRAEWLSHHKEYMKLAMQVKETKNYPWYKAANVKYPLISVAALQFQARSFGVMVPGNSVVKAKIVGKDPDGLKKARGDRVGTHMSWQLLEQMEEWNSETDSMLSSLAILGSMFRKTYFSAALGHNVSDLIFPEDLVVAYKTKSLRTAPRITQIFRLYRNEVISRQRMRVFLDIDLGIAENIDESPEVFLEQHCLVDLDEDGYAEPYIVTVHKTSGMAVRIVPRFDEAGVDLGDKGQVARITPIEYYTKYEFLTSPNGGFYGVGFGTLLGPLNETINAVLNMSLDAGHLSNMQGGFMGSGMRLKKGETRLEPGEFKSVNVTGATIRDSIVPLTYPGPSLVLFQLLGFLVDTGNRLSSIQDIMTGKAIEGETATTSMIRVEQGAKLFTSITDRLHRSLKKELQKLYRLNSIYLDEAEYQRVLDPADGETATRADYDTDDFDVTPASDPGIASDQYQMAQAEALLPFRADPLMDPKEIISRYLTAIKMPNIEALFAKQEPHAGPPPEVVAQMAGLENDRLKIDNDRAKIDLEWIKAEVNAQETMAKVVKLLAEAEAIEPGLQMEQYKMQAKLLANEINLQGAKLRGNKQQGMENMGREPDNTGISAAIGGRTSSPFGRAGGIDRP